VTDFFLGCDGGGTKTDLVVVATRRRLGFSCGEIVPVSYSGGTFAMPEVLDGFLTGIEALSAGYRVSRPRYAPAIGAALYAAALGGTPLDDAALQALPATLTGYQRGPCP
jgi:hypothetical protein